MNLPRLQAFLTELKFNNTREWFDAHRNEYQTLREEFIEFMAGVLAGVAEADPGVSEIRARDTLFRINRDVRFAHDKSPYKVSFSAAISPGGRHSSLPLYYVQIGTDESFVAGGIYGPPPADVAIIRAYIGRFPAKADALLSHPQLHSEFGGLATESLLKRFPNGFERVSELLKYRSFTVSAPLDTLTPDELSARVVQKCRTMQPLHAWLREALAYRQP